MATTYKIQYAVSATPIEEVTLNDGTDTARVVHSNIDKSVGGSNEISCSTTSTNVNYKDYTTTTSYVTLNDSTIYSTTITNADFLMVKIREAGSTGTPDVFMHVAGVSDLIKLSGVGDATLLRLNAIEGVNIKLKSSGATELAKVDILYGLES